MNPPRLLAMAMALALPITPLAAQWQMIEGDSRLGFVASYDGAPIDGQFGTFHVTLDFDPTAKMIELSVTVDVTSVDTDSRDRDEALADADWFAFEQHPEAVYRSNRVVLEDDGRYCAYGSLRLKGIERELPIKFTWEQTGGQASLKGSARMIGDAELNRMDFEIGSGDWADPVIGHEVAIRFDLKLVRVDES